MLPKKYRLLSPTAKIAAPFSLVKKFLNVVLPTKYKELLPAIWSAGLLLFPMKVVVPMKCKEAPPKRHSRLSMPPLMKVVMP